jgi:hypothetical protein
LAKLAGYFRKNPDIDILFGDIIVCDADLHPLCYRQAILPWRSHIRRCFLPTFSAATFVRRKVIDEGYLLDTRFQAIADAVWIHQLLGCGFRAATFPEPLSLFVQTGENLGHSPASLREAHDWRRLALRSNRVQALALKAVHHLRKMLAGAYATRQLNFSYHTGNPPSTREFSGHLSGKWPQSTV